MNDQQLIIKLLQVDNTISRPPPASVIINLSLPNSLITNIITPSRLPCGIKLIGQIAQRNISTIS